MAGSGLSTAELAEFREIFDLVDKDKGGSISSAELAELMTTLGINASQEEISAMVAEIDTDGNGDIDFDEFVAVMSRKVNANYTSKDVKRAFKTFSLGQPNNFVSMQALKTALMAHGSVKLDSEQVDELLAQLEADSSGLFNYTEYVDMMMR
jgi:calmodulin